MQFRRIHIVLAIALILGSAAFAKETRSYRFAISIGANNGGSGRELLKYAVTDAKSFLSVMQKIGGIQHEYGTLLIEPTVESLAGEITTLRETLLKLKKSESRTEVIIYYSGHSDEDGLLLGREKMSYKDLRSRIDSLPADVTIAILDSCSSGAFTRSKGGTMSTPFMTDASYNMKGYAFMTSSSSDEVSQESERIKGSFFTHFLLSGLRGAADLTQDGRITLNEAYQYAYRETLLRTERTAGGAQHPNYHIQMSGTGDVVLTDIRSNPSLLTLAAPVSGRIYVNSDNTVLVELSKEVGEPLSIALDEGNYTVLQESQGGLYEAKVSLRRGTPTKLSLQSFTKADRELTKKRGGSDNIPINKESVAFYVFPLSLQPGELKNHHFLFHLFGSSCNSVDRMIFGFGLAIEREDIRGGALSAVGNINGNDAKAFVIGGIFNTTGNDFSGVQLAGITNVTMRDFKGVQLAGIVNITGRNFKGVQTALAANVSSQDFSGVQMSIFTNVNRKSFTGLQLNAIGNYTGGDFSGAQIGTIFNSVRGEMHGMQLSYLNIADVQNGLQLGLVNISGDAHGTQIGLFNYSRTNDGYPIAPLNFVRNGITKPTLWIDETGTIFAGIHHGNGRIYNLYSLGYNRETRSLGDGIGIGIQWKPGNATIASDLNFWGFASQNSFFAKSKNYRMSLRLTFGYRLFDMINLFIGGSYNYSYVIQESDNLPTPATGYYFYNSAGKRNRFWPGFFFGAQN